MEGGNIHSTIADLLAAGARRLAAAGIDDARAEARLLLTEATGASLEIVVGWPERPVPAEAGAAFAALVERRARREPMALILGRREFWSLSFAVTRDTLVPRPDSEAVVEAALAAIADRRATLRILDLGTGTGCLLLALLSELSHASGVGVDVSAGALAVARANAAVLGLAERAAFVAGDWGDGLAGSFDLIVGNPPYIATPALAGLADEVRLWEPPAALDGGMDGLAAYRRLAPDLARLLAPGGVAVLEIGAGMAPAVEAVLNAAGLACRGRRADLTGVDRAILAELGDLLHSRIDRPISLPR